MIIRINRLKRMPVSVKDLKKSWSEQTEVDRRYLYKESIMNISKELKKYAKRLGYKTFKSSQIKAIQSICEGKDTNVVANAGFGKSGIIFGAALSREDALIIVVEPTISLIYDQERRLSKLENPIKAASLTSNNKEEHDAILNQVRNHEITILYITPERLQKDKFQKAICKNEPWLIVVDECHLVMDWGTTFRPDYLKIGDFANSLKQRPVMLTMTATARPEDRKLINDSLGIKDAKEIVLSIDKPNLSIIVEIQSDKETRSKKRHIVHLLKRVRKSIERYGNSESVVIYALTPDMVTMAANYLSKYYPDDVVHSHGKLAKSVRNENEMLFLTGKRKIMVATSAFGQGIDKPDIRLVIHLGLPLSISDYYQQAGRSGRDGDKAKALIIYDKGLMKQNEALILSAPKNVQNMMKQRQKELEQIVTGEVCIMRQILGLLGEARTDCNHCSNCQRRRVK